MRKFVIDVDLSPAGLRESAEKIRVFSDWLKEKRAMLIQKLAEIGLQEASIRFAFAVPFYDNGTGADVELSVVQNGRNGYTIRASGEDVCFIEFGAGVIYGNGYPGERPEGVVGIGEYGYHQGKRSDGWWYKDDNDQPQHTLGNPPASGMYYAGETIRQRVYEIAREVFA